VDVACEQTDGQRDRQIQTDRYNEANSRFSLFIRRRLKIKIFKIVSLLGALGGVFSIKEQTHPVGI
jgi:hypothetical protein